MPLPLVRWRGESCAVIWSLVDTRMNRCDTNIFCSSSNGPYPMLHNIFILMSCRRALEELAAKAAAEEEARAAREAAEAAALAHQKAEEELAVLSVEEEKQAAAIGPATGSVSEKDQDLEGSVHGSSIDVQVRS